MYQTFNGKQAIKNKISHYTFNKITQWYFNNNVENLPHSALYFDNRSTGNASTELIFKESSKSKVTYIEPGCEYNSERIANDFIFCIENNKITLYIIQVNSEILKHTPFCTIEYDYWTNLDNKHLIKNINNIPTIDNKQAINKEIQVAIITPILNTCNFLIKKKNLPKNYKYDHNWGAETLDFLIYNIKHELKDKAYITIKFNNKIKNH